MRNSPGITPDSPDFIPQPDGSSDGRDVDRDTQPDADMGVEQLDPMPTNPRRSKYDLCHNPKPNCNDDYRYLFCPATFAGTHTYIFRKPQEYVMLKANICFQALIWPPEVTNEHHRQSNTNFGT